MNALKSGCGQSGLDLNSGWNWQPKNHGWLGSSMISTRSASLYTPEMTMPFSMSAALKPLLNS